MCVVFLSFFQISFVQFSAVYARTLATDPDIDSSLLLAPISILRRQSMSMLPKPAKRLNQAKEQFTGQEPWFFRDMGSQGD